LSAVAAAAAAAATHGKGILSDLYRSINGVEVTTFEESIDVLNGTEITGVGQCRLAVLRPQSSKTRHSNEGPVLPACDAVTFRRKAMLPSSGTLCSNARQ